MDVTASGCNAHHMHLQKNAKSNETTNDARQTSNYVRRTEKAQKDMLSKSKQKALPGRSTDDASALINQESIRKKISGTETMSHDTVAPCIPQLHVQTVQTSTAEKKHADKKIKQPKNSQLQKPECNTSKSMTSNQATTKSTLEMPVPKTLKADTTGGNGCMSVEHKRRTVDGESSTVKEYIKEQKTDTTKQQQKQNVVQKRSISAAQEVTEQVSRKKVHVCSDGTIESDNEDDDEDSMESFIENDDDDESDNGSFKLDENSESLSSDDSSDDEESNLKEDDKTKTKDDEQEEKDLDDIDKKNIILTLQKSFF